MIGILFVIKPIRILLFIVMWNIICGLGIILNGGLGQIKTPGGYLCVGLAGAFAAFSGLAPVVSKRVRKRWCQPDVDFEKGRLGLILIGLIGSAFALMGFGSFLFILADMKPLGERIGYFFFNLFLVAAIFIFFSSTKNKKNRTTRPPKGSPGHSGFEKSGEDEH